MQRKLPCICQSAPNLRASHNKLVDWKVIIRGRWSMATCSPSHTTPKNMKPYDVPSRAHRSLYPSAVALLTKRKKVG